MTTTQEIVDPQQRAQSQTMQVMMPLMFVFLSMSFPSGLALYWITSNTIRIAMQYFFSGWGGLSKSFKGLFNMLPARRNKTNKSRKTSSNNKHNSTHTTIIPDVAASRRRIRGNQYETNGNQSQDGGGSYTSSST